MIKVTIGTPGVSDGTSYYRAAGPMSRLRQQMPNLQIDFPPAFGWHDLKSADILMIQRPGNAEHERIIRFAKQCDVPVWVDMDDDLLDVPMHNLAWEVYSDKQELMKSCLTNADIVSTATEALAVKWRQYNKNVVVIPNGLDEKMLKGYDPICKKNMDLKTIYWRGNSGHVKDLMDVQDDIISIAKEFPKIRWQFAGYWPWHVFYALKKLDLAVTVDHLKAVDMMDYLAYLKHNSTHSIAIVPLEDTPWNRQKSNISWLENTFAGSVVLAPDFPEFKKPGIINYSPTLPFKDQLIGMINTINDRNRSQLVQESLEYIHEHLTLSVVNKIRMQVIDTLLSK